MAPFNPPVNPTNDPNYLGYSRGISQPDADKSYEALFKGLGNVLDAGVKAADITVKTGIQDEVYKQASAIQDDYTKSLEDVSTGKAPTPGGTLNLLGANEASDSIPEGLDNLDGSVSNLVAARASGKISPTYYYGRLLSLAKGLRSQYPGYVDYIDNTISKVTGVNPANAYIRSLSQDINAAVSGANASRNKVANQILQNIGMPGADVMYEGVVKGLIPETEGLQWLHKHKSVEEDLKLQGLYLSAAKGTKEAINMQAADYISNVTSKEVALSFDTLQVGSGTDTPVRISKMIEDSLSGNSDPMTPHKARYLAGLISSQKQVIFNRLWRTFSTPDKDGITPMDKLKGGAEEARKIINDRLAPFDLVSDNLLNEKYGAAYYHANMTKSSLDQSEFNILHNKDIGQYNLNMAALQKLMGPAFYKDYFEKIILADKNITTKFLNYFRNNMTNMVSQPDFARTGQVTTVNGIIQDARNKGIKDPNYVNETVNVVGYITNPKAPDDVKLNAARAAFDPANRGLLSNFKDDVTDPATGKVIPGKVDVYTRYTTKGIVNELYRLSRNDPKVWNNFVDWAEEEFGNQIFRKDINNLRQVADKDNVEVTWSSENRKFNFIYRDRRRSVLEEKIPNPRIISGDVVDTNRYPDYHFVRDVERRINDGLQGLGNVAEVAKKDPEAYMLKTLINMGFDPTKSNVSGIPEKILNALVTSRKARTGAEGVSKSNFAEETGNPSLDEWLKNPAGAIKPQPSAKPTTNIGGDRILGVDIQNIPEGMSARDFMKLLRDRENANRNQ